MAMINLKKNKKTHVSGNTRHPKQQDGTRAIYGSIVSCVLF